MDVRILGPLEVGADDGAVVVNGAKLRALLAVLAVHANRPLSAERLALALWGEDAPPGALKAVKVHVSRLRRALGDPGVLETTPAGYRLVVDPDAERFERALAAGRAALAAGDARGASDLLRDALDLWRGTPLEEFAWAPFAPPEMQRLEELHLEAVESRIEAELAAGHHSELVAELTRLTAEHPWRERLHVQLMLALYRCGRQADALAAYQHARAVLVDQLGIEPGPELHRVHQAVLAQDAALDIDGIRRPAMSRRAQALPAPPNRTIGRERELEAVIEQLRAGAVRLLSLTGPGGVGKTRLALEAARAVEPDFADGAWLVSLAAVKRPEDVAGTIVNALAIVPLAGEPADDVERFLAAKHLLLVIDNCEHLPAAAPYVGRLPAAGPGITVLVTSREPLTVNAEQVHPVAPLPPDDAVALFRERARAHDPDFELRADNAGAVAEICRRVDGLPLAIELAAARCGLLSPAEIAARLDVALGVLGPGARDAPARQQTLRATLDWSHGLLSADEQACFARLAVFAGGATVEAAETITEAGLDVLDLLLAKSLLVRSRPDHGATRIGMLETTRAYAGERFAALSDTEAVHERHFTYFLGVVRRHGLDSAIDGPDANEHLACLDAELENFRAALRWASELGDAHRVLTLSSALVNYWMRRGRFAEAADWVLPALRDSAASADPDLYAFALGKAFWPLWDVRRTDELRPLIVEAEGLPGKVRDPAIRAELLYNLAAIQCLVGRRDAGRPTADEALATARASGDAWIIAMAAWARTLPADGADELRERTDAAASLLAKAGNAYHLATLFSFAVGMAWRRGSDADALMYLDRAVPAARRLQQPYRWMCVLNDVGLAALLQGDTAAAEERFREAHALSQELVLPGHESIALTGLAAVAAVQGQPERAARLARAAAPHRDADQPVTWRLETTYLEPAGIMPG
jgi:predicted ATPase/DNA-binding SARP family transcriptional activator